jgi:DNA mismatch repair protein MutS2
LKAVIPKVGHEGVVELVNARHPLLVLRGIDVIGHDLSLSSNRPALVLTGPNTGGKTVALKTVGLAAWMVRHAVPVPGADGSRVDWFDDVLADVGDAQAVADDLSSFSAQLVAVRAMLERAGVHVLLLLDELASGTDPAQGAALAQAVLEALVTRGARIVTTTHYPPLKGLATTDPRFAVAAMEVRDGQPTYRLIPGATGESHALETAARLGIDRALVDRAARLVRETDRGFSDALTALELQRAGLTAREEALVATQAEAERLRRELEARTEHVRERARELEARSASAFQERLRAAERAIGAVVAQLQANPSHKTAAAARHTLDAFAGLLPAEIEESVPAAPRALQVGDRVRHAKFGVGEVVALGRSLKIRGRALEFTAKTDELELIGGPATPAPAPPRPLPASGGKAPKERELGEALRVPANTVDLRGMRVDEAMDAVGVGLDRAAADGFEVVFVLHGHGTGALKAALREQLGDLPAVQRWAPANADQGGDAYTVVAVRG